MIKYKSLIILLLLVVVVSVNTYAEEKYAGMFELIGFLKDKSDTQLKSDLTMSKMFYFLKPLDTDMLIGTINIIFAERYPEKKEKYFKKANKSIDAILKKNRNDFKRFAYFLRSYMFLIDNNFLNAIKIVKKIYELDPEWAAQYTLLGYIEEKRGNLQKAETYYREALTKKDKRGSMHKYAEIFLKRVTENSNDE